MSFSNENDYDSISKFNQKEYLAIGEFTSCIDRYDWAIHPDLNDLIWIGDGPLKNIDLKSRKHSDQYVTVAIITDSDIEPSAIFTKLPISEQTDFQSIPKLDYYPSYRQMSPEQRWKYLHFLRNPYNTDFEIGYVFTLYYGLERHLVSGNYDKAFNVITKLRQVHTNRSFLAYSLDALLISTILKNRNDNLDSVLRNTDHINPAIVILSKVAFKSGLSAKELMVSARSFGFSNRRYINSHPVEFEEHLHNEILTVHPGGFLPISDYLSVNSPKSITLVFANISLKQRIFKTLNLFEVDEFKTLGYTLLQKAHDCVKKSLSQNKRKKQS
jgi:hypothetical protein